MRFITESYQDNREAFLSAHRKKNGKRTRQNNIPRKATTRIAWKQPHSCMNLHRDFGNGPSIGNKDVEV